MSRHFLDRATPKYNMHNKCTWSCALGSRFRRSAHTAAFHIATAAADLRRPVPARGHVDSKYALSIRLLITPLRLLLRPYSSTTSRGQRQVEASGQLEASVPDVGSIRFRAAGSEKGSIHTSNPSYQDEILHDLLALHSRLFEDRDNLEC
jgi:hypothetical protein